MGSDDCTIKIFSTETDEAMEILAGELLEKMPQIVGSADGRTLLLRVVAFNIVTCLRSLNLTGDVILRRSETGLGFVPLRPEQRAVEVFP